MTDVKISNARRVIFTALAFCVLAGCHAPPAGADPADVAAEKQRRLEKRIAARLDRGDLDVTGMLVRFRRLSAWDYSDGLVGMPAAIRALDGKKVTMVGFMVPIDEVENIKEFWLAGSILDHGGSTHSHVRVVVPNAIDFRREAIRVEGRFCVSATVEDGFAVDIYHLTDARVTTWK